MGSWVTYGLGTENENLPGFVVLISSGVQPSGGQGCWGSGFLPSRVSGRAVPQQGRPGAVSSSDPAGHGPRRCAARRSMRCSDLNELQAAELGHPETATRIAQYELAFRMQTSVPEVMDISKEPQQTLDAYGAKPGEASFANNCLLARRLVEQGRALRAISSTGAGTSTAPAPDEDIRDGLTQKVRRDRQAGRRADQRPEAARPARRHARRLGRRVRPHAVPRRPHRRRARSSAAITTPTASRSSSPAAA